MQRDKDQAIDQAQAASNRDGKTREAYQHVGDYGRPGGDIEATHAYRVVIQGDELPPIYALIAIVEPSIEVR